MSIAQHSVAGEGVAHPVETANPFLDNDKQAHAEFACDTTNLPWIIFRAAHRAAHVTGLPTRARSVFAALARTVDAARPNAAIFARRELLTGRSMQSMRTFYRSLDDLESAGLISRPPQKRHGDHGLFGRSYLYLTEKAALILGLVDAAPTDWPTSPSEEQETKGASAPAVSLAPPSANVADAAPTDWPTSPSEERETMGASATAVSLAPPSANVADRAIYKDLFPTSFQKRQHGEVPEDLKRLQTVGFGKYFIFRLMREARVQYGKRLSDVVEVCWEQIRGARYPINYLRKLIASPTDFGWLAKQRGNEARAVQETATRQRKEGELRARITAATFYDRAADKRFVVSDDGQSITVRSAQESVARVAADGWISWFAKGLDAGVILPSSEALELRFEEKLAEHREPISAPAPKRDGGLPGQRSALVVANWDTLRSMVGLRPRGLSA